MKASTDFFEHHADRHVLVLADDYSAHVANAGYESIPYYPKDEGGRRERDHIDTWKVAQTLTTSTVVLDDYDFTRPITYVKNNETHTIDCDRVQQVGGDETLAINGVRKQTVGKDESVKIDGARTKEVVGNETITVHGSRTQSVEGSESVTIDGARSQKVGDETIAVRGSRSEKVNGSETITIGAACSLRVSSSLSVDAGGSHSTKVGADETTTVSGAQTVTVGGAHTTTVGGDETLEVSGGRNVTIGGPDALSAVRISVDAQGALELSCGGSSIKMSPGSIALKSPMISVAGDGAVNRSGRSPASWTKSTQVEEHDGTRVPARAFNVKASGVLSLSGALIKQD